MNRSFALDAAALALLAAIVLIVLALTGLVRAAEPVPLPKTCSHWLPDGSFVVLIGRHDGMNPEATLQHNADS